MLRNPDPLRRGEPIKETSLKQPCKKSRDTNFQSSQRQHLPVCCCCRCQTPWAVIAGSSLSNSAMSVPPEESEASRTEPSSNTEPIYQQLVGVAPTTIATKESKNMEKRGFLHNVDGGGRGWASVMGAWLIQFSMLGAVLSFGSYQTFYQDQWLSVSSDMRSIDADTDRLLPSLNQRTTLTQQSHGLALCSSLWNSCKCH